MVFAGIGAWLIFQNRINQSLKIKSDMAAFALIVGLLGVYFSSAFVRLEVLGSISLIILASIGVSILISKILKEQHSPAKVVTKISFLGMIVVLLTIPLTYPDEINWSEYLLETPPTIFNAGTHFLVATNDWPDAMQWIKENTPKDSVIASWWDYGYWISVLGERKSISDNATLLDWQIKKTASMFFSPTENAWKILTSDTRTEVSSHYVSFPMTSSLANNLEERKLELFTDWRFHDGNNNGIVNGEETSEWWPKGGDKCYVGIGGEWSCPKYRLNPGTIDQYPTVFDYWETEVYEMDPALGGLDADYILIGLAGLVLPEQHTEALFYFGDKGGDMTKAYWMMKIANLPLRDYYNPDGKSFNDRFWNETLIGKMIPFIPLVYLDVESGDQSLTWTKHTNTPVYVQDIKFPTKLDPLGDDCVIVTQGVMSHTDCESAPFQLVYSSPSFFEPVDNMIVGVLIYKINHDYEPSYDLYNLPNQ
jgi:dolichyl-diphosphooligosaccharide--protein glycosyltransferase